jgi:hypothetical protein
MERQNMASIRLPGGARGVRLAELIAQHNPDSHWERSGDGLVVEARRLEVERAWVEQAYWPGSPADARAVERYMRHFLRVDPKTIQPATPERLIIADELEAEQALLVRFPALLKERLARVAESLGMSQNELVVRAVDDFVSFADEVQRERMEGA